MPGRPRKIPSYGRHKGSGQAVVCINGHDLYPGKYGTPESYEKYNRLIAECFPRGPNPPTSATVGNPAVGGDLTVIELVAAHWQHAKSYYVKNGKATSEQTSIRLPLKLVNAPDARAGGQGPSKTS